MVQINDPDNPYYRGPGAAPSQSNPATNRLGPAGATKHDVFSPAAAPAGSTNNFTFDPANADKALRAGLLANGFNLNNPENSGAAPILRRGGDLARLFPLLAALNPQAYGNANSTEDSQKFFSGLPGNFESLIHGNDPNALLSGLFQDNSASSANGALATPLGGLQDMLNKNPNEMANLLGAILGINATPYAGGAVGRTLENLIANTSANAGLLNAHGGNLLGAVAEALKGVKTFQ